MRRRLWPWRSTGSPTLLAWCQGAIYNPETCSPIPCFLYNPGPTLALGAIYTLLLPSLIKQVNVYVPSPPNCDVNGGISGPMENGEAMFLSLEEPPSSNSIPEGCSGGVGLLPAHRC